jgi:D-alanine-D-alanine ligase
MTEEAVRATRVLVLHNDVSDAGCESEKGVLDEVARLLPALTELGVAYDVVAVRDPRDLGSILAAHPAHDVVWNFYESPNKFYAPGSLLGEAVPVAAELFGKGCTGGPTFGMRLTLDKALTKHMLRALGVPVPRDIEAPPTMTRAEFDAAYAAQFGARPARLIVKPACSDGSEGIYWDKSIFACGAAAADVWAQVAAIHAAFRMPALVEELVGAGELNISVLEDTPGHPRVLAVAEIDFSPMPAHLPRVVDYAAKWDPASPMYLSVRKLPAAIPPAAMREAERVALLAWQATACRDYGRVDMRYDVLTDGSICLWVLEVNMNPDLSLDAGFPAALEYAGISFTEFVRIVVTNAFKRSRKYDLLKK